MPMLKNQKHETFAQALAKGQTADEAYQVAGFSANRGNATRLKAKESIRKRVAEIAENAANRAEIDIARTLKELVRLGTSDVRRLFDENGNLRAIHELDDETASAVSSVEVVTRTLGKGEDGEPPEVEYIHKLKLWDKNSALDKIAKHLGMFIDRHEHTGAGGGPIKTEDVSARDLIHSRIARVASRVGEDGSDHPSNGSAVH